MTPTKEYIEILQQAFKDLEKLNEDYSGKRKGRRYQHKLVYLTNRINFYKAKLAMMDKGTINVWQVWTEHKDAIIRPSEVLYHSFLGKEDIIFINKYMYQREILEIELVKSIKLGELNPSFMR